MSKRGICWLCSQVAKLTEVVIMLLAELPVTETQS
jgi:hypothetical protein